jgi:TolA-binding protein
MPILVMMSCLLLFLTGCKTSEQIQRERMVDDLAEQFQEVHSRIQELEKRLSNMTGKMEESAYSNQQKTTQELKKMQEQIALLTEQSSSQQEKVDVHEGELKKIGQEVESHRDFLEQMIKTLEGIGARGKIKNREGEKEEDGYDKAMALYKKEKFKEARPLLERLVDDRKIKGEQKARVLHHLGVTEFFIKDYENATIHLGRLYTEHSKSDLNQNGLLVLGRSFLYSKQKDKAEQTFQELINRYPKSGKAEEARKEIAKLRER